MPPQGHIPRDGGAGWGGSITAADSGVLILERHGLADDFVGHRQRDTLSVANAVEDVDVLERSVLAVIEVATDYLVLVRMGLFLDGVVTI